MNGVMRPCGASGCDICPWLSHRLDVPAIPVPAAPRGRETGRARAKCGLELVEELQAARPDVRVLLASGYTDTKSQWEAIRDRGFGFLQKPYGISALLLTIRETIGSA